MDDDFGRLLLGTQYNYTMQWPATATSTLPPTTYIPRDLPILGIIFKAVICCHCQHSVPSPTTHVLALVGINLLGTQQKLGH